jgi:hypothetical protein
MSIQNIQFRQGVLIPKFLDRFSTDVRFAEAIGRERWLSGFRSPRCDSEQQYVEGRGASDLFQVRRLSPSVVSHSRHPSGRHQVVDDHLVHGYPSHQPSHYRASGSGAQA